MFDTLKLKISDPSLLNLDGMLRTETFHPDSGDPYVRYVYPRSKFGTYISYKKDDESFSIEFSAKVLREDYLSGVRPHLLDKLSGNIKLTTTCLRHQMPVRCFLESGVYRADHTINLRTERTTNLLRMLRDSASWGRKMVDRRFGDSAIFYNTRESIIAYDKPAEVFRYWSDFEGLGIPKSKYKDILRVEYRPKKIDVMRSNVGQKDKFTELAIPSLQSLIDNFKTTIEHKIGSFSFSEHSEISDYSEFLFGSGKLDTNLKILGLYTYFKSIGFDEKVFENEIKRIESKSQRSKVRSKLKDFAKIDDNKIDYKELADEFKSLVLGVINEY